MLVSHGLAYLGTVSRPGRPRVTPVSVVFDGDSLFVSLIRSTPKCRELETTPFFHLQALPGPRQEEFSVRGCARTVDDHQEISGLRKAQTPPGSSVTVVVAGIAVWATVNGHGPFSHLPY